MAKTSIVKPAAPLRYQNKWMYLDDLRAGLLLIFACVVCYGNTVFNEYSLDDDFAVTKNAYIQNGLAGIPDLLTHSYVTTSDLSADYRPVSGISFAIEYQFFGANPHVSHFINLLLFIICVLIVFRVLKKVFALDQLHPVLPLFIALIYAVHPVHNEVVASIKNRDEILSFSFMLLVFLNVFYFFRSTPKQARHVFAIFLFLLLSLTSKLTSMPVLGIVVLTGFYFEFHKQKKAFYILYPAILAFAVTYFLIIMYFTKRPMYDLENPLIAVHDLSIRLGTSLETLFFYFKFLLVPFPSRFYYGYNVIPVIPFSDSASMVSLFIHLGLFTYGVLLLLRKQVLGLFLIAYLLSVFLYSNLIIIYPGIVSERVLFSPSLWFCSVLLLFVFRIAGFGGPKEPLGFLHKLLLTVGVLVLFTYSWLTIQRNFQWKNALTLMSSDMPHLTNSTLANYFYASNLQEAAERSTTDSARIYYLEEAKKYFRQAIHISPAYPEPYFKLGMILEYGQQEYDSAFHYFYTARLYDTVHTPLQFQLAKSYLMKGNLIEADKLFSELFIKIPNDTFTLFFYSRVKHFMGDTINAIKINDQLLNLAPDNYYAYWNRALFYQRSGRFPESVPFYEQAIDRGYRDRDVVNQMINYYASNGQSEKISEIRKKTGI